MNVLDEVKQKRDYSQYRKDCGEIGYDPAIEFYNRVIYHIEALEEECKTIQSVCTG